MSFEYKPHHDSYDSPVDPDRCKAFVPSAGLGFRQCSRKAWHDGWCTQHDPDTVAKRQKQRALKDKQRWERSPLARLWRVQARIGKALFTIDRMLGSTASWEERATLYGIALEDVREILKGESDE